jgi:predicted MFS family arabinose efflux permease
VAGLWVSAYWGCLTVGRLLFGLAADHIRTDALLRIAMIGVLCGAILIWLNPAEGLRLLGLALMGFFAAPIFPSLIASTPDRVGPERAASVVGYQVGAASLGIGLGPALAGVLAERLGLESIPVFTVLAAMALLLLHEWLARRARPLEAVHRMKE